MKIVIVTNEFSSEGGGLSYSCQQLHHLLDSLGHSVLVIMSSVDNKNIITGGYDLKLGLKILAESKLKKDANKVGRNCLLIGFGGGFNGYYTSLLAQKSNNKYWLMFRGSDANLCKWDMQNILYTDYAVRNAQKLIALSQEIADNIKCIVHNNCCIDIIPNHADKKYRIVKPFSNNKITIGTGATHLNEKKGIRLLLETMARFRCLHPDTRITLELVGAVDDEVLVQYKKLSSQLEISKDIKFVGVKTHEEFRNIQKQWDMYIQCSVCEGMGNSVVDCMSMGIPVMITDTGYVAEFAKSVFPNMVFSKYCATTMANELYSLLSSNESIIKYEELYNNFFDNISISNLSKVWKNMLSDEQSPQIHQPVNSMLSVILHDVAGELHDNITTPTSVFAKFVKDISDMGYQLCSMRKYEQHAATERQRYIVCTFDDGYKSLIDNAMPILDKYGFTATVFVCTDYIGKKNDWNYKDKVVRTHLTKDELYTLLNHGWEIGSHGITHRSLLRLNDDELMRELCESKKILEHYFGEVSSYAYPYGDYSGCIMKQVKKYYNSAFLLSQGGNFLAVDSHRIHRYFISDIYQILNER